MRVVVLYGTESGNAELVADDVATSLAGSYSVELSDLQDFEVPSLTRDALFLVVCSTHDEGDLPASAQPFADALDIQSPDLDGVTYAMFGLGDSTYPDYSRGSELLDERLTRLGAVRVGAYGRHDAASRHDASDLAIAWAQETATSQSLQLRMTG